MVSKYAVIGIAVGVFFAGLGIGYAVFQSTQISPMMNQQQMMNQFRGNPQLMRDMFSDPQFMQEMMRDQQFNQMMMSYMMQNPEQVDMWMIQNPQHVQQMSKAMKENHEFMQEMMFEIINDPDLRLQMLGHMTENQETMQQMQQMMQGNMAGKGMGHGMMMDSGMMGQDSMSMKEGSMKKETSAIVDFSDIKITNISANSVTIQGTTNVDVNCQVEYWTANDPKHYFASDTLDMMDMKHTDHKVTIKNLLPNTKYSYKFKATLDGKTFYSSEQTFTTKSA
ncbi:MAG TPA: fibronectin type III domain-containing protein [Candidatus Nitrosotenuis sp.]|nr:fibronectin type III domain-containing protein [Candidatus Nitrosotenuis sp.]